MIEIPASLIERIKARQAVLVAGLGCCQVAELPGWDELGRRLIARIADDDRGAEVKARVGALLDAGRIATAIAYLRFTLSDEAVAEVVKAAYPPGQAAPEALGAVARIPWRGVISTGFDDLW